MILLEYLLVEQCIKPVGPVHYNTLDDIETFGEILRKVAKESSLVLRQSCGSSQPSQGFLRESKRPVSKNRSFFMALNDEHQGEGGTLVFVAVYITTIVTCWQAFES